MQLTRSDRLKPVGRLSTRNQSQAANLHDLESCRKMLSRRGAEETRKGARG